MRLRVSTLIGMIIVISGASFVGRVVKIISIDSSEPSKMAQADLRDSEENIWRTKEVLIMGNKSEHLLWFLQVCFLFFIN